MREWQSQSHVRWYCRYHVVIVPKYRKKAIFGVLRKDIGVILNDLCKQFGVELVEGHAMSDHIHMCLSIPPKLSVAYTIGRLKGKSAVRIHRDFPIFHLPAYQRCLRWKRPLCPSTKPFRRRLSLCLPLHVQLLFLDEVYVSRRSHAPP